MDAATAGPFVDIVALAQTAFEDVEFSTDTTPERALLRFAARYGPYRVSVTELVSDEGRQYRYYVLRGDWVEAGFDNSPDPKAIRLKYCCIGEEHAGEPVPHFHQNNKTELFLTMDRLCDDCTRQKIQVGIEASGWVTSEPTGAENSTPGRPSRPVGG